VFYDNLAERKITFSCHLIFNIRISKQHASEDGIMTYLFGIDDCNEFKMYVKRFLKIS
jgi:hypothetical protein